MADNPLGDLIGFVQGLDDAGITYRLESVRDSIMVVIPCPDRYIEVEFFADGHLEVQYFGPPASDIVDLSSEVLLAAVIAHLHADSEVSPLDGVE